MSLSSAIEGAGKTTIGQRLADRLWRKFVDIDDVIIRNAGKSIKEIFEQDGEDHFRALETAALRECLANREHVLGLGGGTLGREENRRMLRDARVHIVYLRCDVQELLRRVQADPNSAANRPALTGLGGGLDEISFKLAEREPVYREMANAELDVTRMTPDEVVVHIARML